MMLNTVSLVFTTALSLTVHGNKCCWTMTDNLRKCSWAIRLLGPDLTVSYVLHILYTPEADVK